MKSKRRKLTYPNKAKLLFAIFSQSIEKIDEVEKLINAKFGHSKLSSEIFLIESTDYYASEMGDQLKKKFILVEKLIERTELISIKHWAVSTEDQFVLNENRTVNIDPMMMTEEQLLVSTGKLFPHRIYLGEGVFGQLELMRRKGHFDILPWTYPDYKDNIKFFDKCYDFKLN